MRKLEENAQYEPPPPKQCQMPLVRRQLSFVWTCCSKEGGSLVSEGGRRSRRKRARATHPVGDHLDLVERDASLAVLARDGLLKAVPEEAVVLLAAAALLVAEADVERNSAEGQGRRGARGSATAGGKN